MATEKRLIDVNEVLEVICDYCPDDIPCPVGGCAEFQKISRLLTADAVEVVRCKDCKHFSTYDYYGKDMWCDILCENSVVPDFYCAMGERKDNG